MLDSYGGRGPVSPEYTLLTSSRIFNDAINARKVQLGDVIREIDDGYAPNDSHLDSKG